MDIETIFKITSSAGAVIGLGPKFYETMSNGKTKLREEYRFARDFFDDLETRKPHPYAIEKGYHAIAGTTKLRGEEIEYILTLENPVRCLRDFVLSRKYIEHLNTNGDLKIAFTRKYQRPWSRSWRKTFYALGYFVFAFAALSPLALSKPIGIDLNSSVALFAFTLPVCGYIGWTAIRSFTKIMRGEELVFNQSKYTKRIILTTTSDSK